MRLERVGIGGSFGGVAGGVRVGCLFVHAKMRR